jgi:SPP1 gp7 family putative phage head morphogenesis protein
MIADIRSIEKRLKSALASLQRPLTDIALERAHELPRFLPRILEKMKVLVYGAAREAWQAGVRQAQREVQRARFQEGDIPAQWWEWYTTTTDAALHRYTEQTRRDIERVVWQATTEGWSHDRLTEAIRDVVQDLLTWKAERIARTETMRLWNMGHTLELNRFDEVVGFEYSVVLDPRTSHICYPIAGLKVRKSQLQHIPPLHPHCRTILLPIFVGEEPPEWGDISRVVPAKGFAVLPVALLQGAL